MRCSDYSEEVSLDAYAFARQSMPTNVFRSLLGIVHEGVGAALALPARLQHGHDIIVYSKKLRHKRSRASKISCTQGIRQGGRLPVQRRERQIASDAFQAVGLTVGCFGIACFNPAQQRFDMAVIEKLDGKSLVQLHVAVEAVAGIRAIDTMLAQNILSNSKHWRSFPFGLH